MLTNIDIAMTAIIRPEVINKTLKSFCREAFSKRNHKYRLIINVDPIGRSDVDSMSVISICKRYFPKEDIIFNTPNMPSFPKAVKWVWSQVQSEFVFHLEDDWLLLKNIDLNDMILTFRKYDNLASLRLSNKKLKVVGTRLIDVGPLRYEYKREIHKKLNVAIGRGVSFSLNPSLMRCSVIKSIVPLLKENVNPEKQLRKANHVLRDIIMKWDYGVYGTPGDRACVDGSIGRYWREKMRFKKPNKSFITWEKEEGYE
uniref:Glycosyltransferase n=1 Tax=viral metagenome TaxID=1070528 RepID=A0A6M3L343_9ZZZZ